MNYKVPVIAGDGIGPEIIAEGKKVLEAAADKYNFAIEWREYSLGAEHYLKTGELVSEETLKDLSHYRAIYLGAIGDPRVDAGQSWRRAFFWPCASTSTSMLTSGPSNSWRASGRL